MSRVQETPWMEHSSVCIQISEASLPSTPTWLAEVAVFAQVLSYTGALKTIQEQVRFARARFGIYDLIDFVAVLIGYAIYVCFGRERSIALALQRARDAAKRLFLSKREGRLHQLRGRARMS